MPKRKRATVKIEKTERSGFCFGVKRALEVVEEAAQKSNGVETLGAVVHNQQVLQKLAEGGVRVAGGVDDIKSSRVVISAHGISPEVEAELKARGIGVIDTTCPFVRRAQLAARRLAENGFFVVIYGDADHPEVKGILGWANGKGIATMDDKLVSRLTPLPQRLGILSQTTQIPSRFIRFVKGVIGSTFGKGSEIRIIDTICHDIRQRQEAALDLARRVDLMLVIGSRTSANTRHLAKLCSGATKTYLIENAEELQPEWLDEHHHIGVTAGASTAEETISRVLDALEKLPLS